MNENEILGFMAYYLNSSYQQIYITLICVDIKYQSHGIGGMMLDYVTSNTCESDKLYETIALEVNKKNGKAHRFYLKQGFEEQEDRGEKLLMVKHISCYFRFCLPNRNDRYSKQSLLDEFQENEEVPIQNNLQLDLLFLAP